MTRVSAKEAELMNMNLEKLNIILEEAEEVI